MIFAKRQTSFLERIGVEGKTFFLASRTSPLVLCQEIKRIRGEIRSFQPDLIHAHFGSMTGLFCALSAREPLVITFRGSDLNPCRSVSWIRSVVGRVLSQLAVLRCSRVICVSQGLRNQLWWRNKLVAVIPSGVDLSVFHPIPRDVARRTLGWEERQMVVLFNAAGGNRNKRLDLARAAVKVAEEQFGPIRFEILDGNVNPDTIPLVMNAADCLLLTSDWEGSPNIVKEAMACNLPVISVEVGDVRERLAGVHPTRLMERHPAALGIAIAEVLADGIRSNGYDVAIAVSQERVMMQVLSVYRSVFRLSGSSTEEGG